MKNFRGTKNLKNILEELKSNVHIFKETIYLFKFFLEVSLLKKKRKISVLLSFLLKLDSQTHRPKIESLAYDL